MPTDIDRWLREAVAAIKKGDKDTGRDLLMRIIEKDEMHEQAWLWLSAVVEEREERIICLENVLTINPHNTAAQNGLKKLGAAIPQRLKQADAPPDPGNDFFAGASGDLLDTYEDAPDPPPAQDAWREAVTAKPSGSDEKNPIIERAEQKAAQKRKRQEVLESVPQGRERDLLELFNAWVAALTFQERHLIAEMKAATPLRVMINVGFAMLIAGGLGFIGFFVFSNQPLPPEIQAQFADFTVDYQQNAGVPFPLTFEQFTNAAFAIAAFSSIIGVVINAGFLSITTHVGARMLGAKGEFIQTAHAVTMAIVAQQIVGMVPNLLTTIAQVGTGVVGILLTLYNIAVAAVTLSAAHEDFGFGQAIAAYIAGGIVGFIVLCVCGCLAVFGLSFLAAG